MQMHHITLTDEEFEAMNTSNPASKKNADIGARAIAILRLYAVKNNWTEVHSRRAGVDLTFITTVEGEKLEMEVKGTADKGIQWQKLGVSGKPCFENLTKGMPLYRVSSVFAQTPTIFILKCGDDFIMDTELRWKIKQKK